MVKRIGLFVAVNILVMITISILLNVLGLRGYVTPYGIDYGALMVFCLVWGMTGALISLALSRFMAKRMMGVQVISPASAGAVERNLLETVDRLARAARIPMPEVGIYPSDELNAFATGPTKARSLVAVSAGLARRMNQAELEGVLAHEISHIANGDMVTMTLLQGVANAFAMFLARAIAFALRRDDDRGVSQVGGFIVQVVLEIVFMILGSMVVAWFSRYREYRADGGGARLAGREQMVAALTALQRTADSVDSATAPAFQAMKISSPVKLSMLFASHPPLADRIARLQSGAY